MPDDINKKQEHYPSVLIVIVNFNGATDTIECIKSLEKISFKNYQIQIVDNSSDEENKKLLITKLSNKIKVIYSSTNLGFAGGNNIGIKESLKKNYDYTLLLNNDTLVEPDFLTNLTVEAQKNCEIGILAPKINYNLKRNFVWSAGGRISRIRGSGFSKYENKKDSKEIKNRDVEFVSGCCLLIKNEVFEKVGLLDENYFLYLEDTDFCQRVINAGFKIRLVASSKIYHKVNSTTARHQTSLPIYYTTRNRLYFSKKLLGNWYYAVLSYLFITMHFKFLYWYLTNKKDNIIAVRRAFKDFHINKMGKTEDL